MKEEMKKSGDKARYIFAKVMMNSLFGKFASNPRNFKNFFMISGENLSYYIDDLGYDLESQINENVFVVAKPIEEHQMR